MVSDDVTRIEKALASIATELRGVRELLEGLRPSMPPLGTVLDAQILDWLERGVKRAGKNRVGLAKALETTPSQVTKILQGRRTLKVHEVAQASAYLEEPFPL